MKCHLLKARLVVLFAVLVSMVLGCTRALPVSLPSPKDASSFGVSHISVSPSQRNELDSACLVGKWSVSNIQQTMYKSYLQSKSAFQLESIEGQAEYEFDTQGWMTITFIHLSATLNGEMDGQTLRIRQIIGGSAVARYSVDKMTSRLMLTSFGGDGIDFALEINEQRLVEGDFPVWRAFTSESSSEIGKPTSLVEYAQVQVECSGDALMIQAVDPLPGPEIILNRID